MLEEDSPPARSFPSDPAGPFTWAETCLWPSWSRVPVLNPRLPPLGAAGWLSDLWEAVGHSREPHDLGAAPPTFGHHLLPDTPHRGQYAGLEAMSLLDWTLLCRHERFQESTIVTIFPQRSPETQVLTLRIFDCSPKHKCHDRG